MTDRFSRSVRLVGTGSAAALASFLWLAGAAAAHGSESSDAWQAPATVIESAAGPGSDVGAGGSLSAANVVVNKVVLTTADEGATRTYRATVFEKQGRAVEGAVLDIGGLTNDPDLRVVTTPMKAISSTSYQATVTYPAAGSWVVVVRVHYPSTYVHLGSEEVTEGGEAVAAHLTPSRIALEKISPNLGGRLSAIQNGTTVSSVSGHQELASDLGGQPLSSVEADSLASDIGYSLLHLAGVGAWLLAVAAVAVSGWASNSPFGHNLLAWVTPRYSMLAGGGLAVVAVTGISNLQRSGPPGLFDGTITETATGRVYLGALAMKLGLVAASVLTSIQLGSRLRKFTEPKARFSPGSVGMAALHVVDVRVQRLAVRNMMFAVLIVGCVNVMSQVHRLLH